MPSTKPLPVVLSAALAVALGCLLWSAKPVQASSLPSPSSGRFQICGESGNIYILDTATGQVWQELATPGHHEGGNDGPFYRAKLDVAR